MLLECVGDGRSGVAVGVVKLFRSCVWKTCTTTMSLGNIQYVMHVVIHCRANDLLSEQIISIVSLYLVQMTSDRLLLFKWNLLLLM